MSASRSRALLLLVGTTAEAALAPAPVANLVHPFNGFDTKYTKREGGSAAGSKRLPVVLVHGFGGSSGQWRATVEDVAASGRTVYALDLLGFGASPKPPLDSSWAFQYSIETWADQLQRFVDEIVCAQDGHPSAVLVGNSIGSLSCLYAASLRPPNIAGVGLFNAAIGMNSKAPPLPSDPLAYSLFFNTIGGALFTLIDLLLRSPLARQLFDSVRSDENVRSVLEGGCAAACDGAGALSFRV